LRCESPGLVCHMNKPRVLLADDHRILAEGLRALLDPEYEVVGVVADGRELVSAAKALRPDVIIADISMPSFNGFEAAAQVRAAGVEAKVIFLTMHSDVAYARRAMEAGAAGFVLKHSAAIELVTAVREVLRGKTYVTPRVAGELIQSYRPGQPGPGEPGYRLTARQREVLELIAEGRSAKEVAVALEISVRTAEAHKARILECLGLRTTAELVQYAIRNDIICL
jgi:DNA-binding NarL/FixJ family response regulator